MHKVGAGLSKEDNKSKPQCYTAAHQIRWTTNKNETMSVGKEEIDEDFYIFLVGRQSDAITLTAFQTQGISICYSKG